jgi:hypothetical protein
MKTPPPMATTMLAAQAIVLHIACALTQATHKEIKGVHLATK